MKTLTEFSETFYDPKILKNLKKEKIAHLQASSNYTFLTMDNGGRMISAYTLKVFADLFDENSFLRIDRSNLVNRNFIQAVVRRGKKYFVQLKNQDELPIPRRKKHLFKREFQVQPQIPLGYGQTELPRF